MSDEFLVVASSKATDNERRLIETLIETACNEQGGLSAMQYAIGNVLGAGSVDANEKDIDVFLSHIRQIAMIRKSYSQRGGVC